MRRLWFVVVILIAVIGGLNSMPSSRRSAADEQAMRDRVKAEVKAELQAELAESRSSPTPPRPPIHPIPTQQVEVISDRETNQVPTQQTSELKNQLLNRLQNIDRVMATNGGLGAGYWQAERTETLRALTDIEMAERGASSQSIETVRQRRAADDTQQAMDEQSRQMRQMQWDMEQQRQQLEEQRRETERLQQAENHRKWYGE